MMKMLYPVLRKAIVASAAFAWIWILPGLIHSVVAAGPGSEFSSEQLEFFEKKIRPLLADNCFNCHSANTNSQGGLRVDDRNGLISGGNTGSALVPGKPDESLIIGVVEHTADTKMPPKKKLTDEQIADLRKWVADGAAWTPPEESPDPIGVPNEKYEQLLREHWAWQPLKEVSPPTVRNEAWVEDEVDRFILAKLEESGLAPVRDADRATLIRRLSFDLTGLPPTPEEIAAFEQDESRYALEKVVDRLLASDAFAERWGRHWLDVARYGESTGSSRNIPFPQAWRYRDYVIDSFRNDKPYDRFLQEQIAGDLLPAKSEDEKEQNQIATGFLALGVKDVNQRYKVRFVMDNVDEQIDTVTRAVLGVTASCARCHDHKFDPVSLTDYYALAGIFTSTDLCAGVRNKMGGGGLDYYDTKMLLVSQNGVTVSPDQQQKIDQATAEFEAARKEFQRLRLIPEGDEKTEDGRPKRMVARQKMNQAQNALLALTDPAVTGKVILGVRESAAIGDTEVRIRGEAEKLGPKVPRGFLSLVKLPDQPSINPSQSGRAELAQWLTNPKNPLTTRVIVNRVWKHLFGVGIVQTVDNFGVTGSGPSHPELLDHLANRFVSKGWSIKKLIKSLVLSHTYRLSGERSAAGYAVDPDNRLQWRHSPRRLDAEELRDAMLVAAESLDRTRPTGSPAQELKVIELPNNGPIARKLLETAQKSRHRSVYLPLLRGITPISLAVFDFAEQGMVTGARDSTTVSPQSLYLLNDPLVRELALDLAKKLTSDETLSDEVRIERAYLKLLGRRPVAQEVERAKLYLSEFELAVAPLYQKTEPTPVDESKPVAQGAELVAAVAPQVAAGFVSIPEVGVPPTPVIEGVNNAASASSPAPAVAANTPTLVATAGAPVSTSATNSPARPAVPVNPDEVISEDPPETVVEIPAPNARAAAWASFCQAILGSGEFRYVD